MTYEAPHWELEAYFCPSADEHDLRACWADVYDRYRHLGQCGQPADPTSDTGLCSAHLADMRSKQRPPSPRPPTAGEWQEMIYAYWEQVQAGIAQMFEYFGDLFRVSFGPVVGAMTAFVKAFPEVPDPTRCRRGDRWTHEDGTVYRIAGRRPADYHWREVGNGRVKARRRAQRRWP